MVKGVYILSAQSTTRVPIVDYSCRVIVTRETRVGVFRADRGREACLRVENKVDREAEVVYSKPTQPHSKWLCPLWSQKHPAALGDMGRFPGTLRWKGYQVNLILCRFVK